MPLYSDHYYYGSGQPPPYYMPSSPYTSSTSRISSPYSVSYMSPISAMLSAGIGTNPVPRGLRSYSPMLSAISEAGSPLMSRRDIGNHRSSPRHLGSKTFYRQKPVIIDTDSLDLSKRKKDDNEEIESTPGMISRGKTIVRMHTRKLKENPELKKKKTQAEILMEKYFIKEKPIKEEEEVPRRKRIWEEREENLNNTLARSGTIKRSNTIVKVVPNVANLVPVDDIDVTEKDNEIIPVRKMSIDSELFKEEEALLDCMIQEELGLTNRKEMKIGDEESGTFTDGSNVTNRKSNMKKEQLPYGRRKSSLDVVDETGAVVAKMKSHARKKKTSKTLPIDEVNSGEGQSSSDSTDVKDENKLNRRKSTRKKKAPKFKIDSLHVEEKSSPTMLRKFQYEVIVEEGNGRDRKSLLLNSAEHINQLNKEDIPEKEKAKLLSGENIVKSDVFCDIDIDRNVNNTDLKSSNDICDSKCDNVTNNVTKTSEHFTNTSCDKNVLTSADCVSEIDKIDDAQKQLYKLVNKHDIEGILDTRLHTETESQNTSLSDTIKKQKTDNSNSVLGDSGLVQPTGKTGKNGIQREVDKDINAKTKPVKKEGVKSPQPAVKFTANKIKEENTIPENKTSDKMDKCTVSTDKDVIAKLKGPSLDINTLTSSSNISSSEDKKNVKESLSSINILNSLSNSSSSEDKNKNVPSSNTSEQKVPTLKQKSLTPDFNRKILPKVTTVAPKSNPNTPIMSKKTIMPLSSINKFEMNLDHSLGKNISKTKSDGLNEKLAQTQQIFNKLVEVKPLCNKEVSNKDLKDQAVDHSRVKEGSEIEQAIKTNKSTDEIMKDKYCYPELVIDVKREDLPIVAGKKETVPFNVKSSQSDEVIQEVGKTVQQLNTENNKALIGDGEKTKSTGLLTKDVLPIKSKENLNVNLYTTGKTQNNFQPKERVLQTRSKNEITKTVELPIEPRPVILQKGEIHAHKETSEKISTVNNNYVKELCKDKTNELKSESNSDQKVDQFKVEEISAAVSTDIIKSSKKAFTGSLLKNHEKTENDLKNKSDEKVNKTVIKVDEKTVFTKKEDYIEVDTNKITKQPKDANKDKVTPLKHEEKSFINPGQKDNAKGDILSKDKNCTLNLTSISPDSEIKNKEPTQNNQHNEKVGVKKLETTKEMDNKQTLNTPVIAEKVDKIHMNVEKLKDVSGKIKPNEDKLQDKKFNDADNYKNKMISDSKVKQADTKLLEIPSKQVKFPPVDVKPQDKLDSRPKVTDIKAEQGIDTNQSGQKAQTVTNETEPSSKITAKSKVEAATNFEKKFNLNIEKPIKDEKQTKKEKKKRLKSESDALDECSGNTEISTKESISKVIEKSQSLKENTTEKSSKKKKKSKDKDSSKKKKNVKSPRKKNESPKTSTNAENKLKDALTVEQNEEKSKCAIITKTTTTTNTSTTTVNTSEKTTTSTTTASEEAETTSRELSKRSTRLLHFINKCMRLSEDDDNIFIDYSDEDESSSSECTTDSDCTSDSEEDTLTEDSSDGSSESRDHGSPTRRHSNAALSLDDESTRHAHGAGRVTPPATTIPKFRKYTMDDFQFLKVLGKGSFGKVLLAELRGTQYYYAVKCLKKDVVLEDDDVECTLIERKVLALGTNHPYLCHLFCTFQTESHLFFVMEYLNGGDLMFHIQQQGRFDEGRARFYAAEIVSGLKFLHKKGIVYRDLKLDNILLDFDGHVRIADFGMCKLQIYLDRTADTFCGTPDYMAPEIIKGLKYNQCVDWWSFGILLYEMLVGQSPFSGCDEDDLFWCICNRQPHYPRFITLEAKRILMQLLEKEASKRLGSCENGALEVMGHPFFNGLDWDRLERRELVPPFKPNVKHPLDVHYFDKHFTAERACLTPIDPSILQSMDQTQFQGFSYTNPNVTD